MNAGSGVMPSLAEAPQVHLPFGVTHDTNSGLCRSICPSALPGLPRCERDDAKPPGRDSTTTGIAFQLNSGPKMAKSSLQ